MALDFVAGCVGGCAGLAVGHPFDTLKVRLQTDDLRNPKYKGTLHCLSDTIRKESWRGLYKGIMPPMAGVAAVNAIAFGVYGAVQRRLDNPETLTSLFMAGACAGVAQSVVVAPMEMVKSRMQIQTTNRGAIHCLREQYKHFGIRGVYKGMGITVCREIPGFGSYFVGFEVISRYLTPADEAAPTWALLLSGGLAGTLSWVITQPFDIIKSRVQVDGVNGPPKYNGAIDCFRKSMQSEGPRFIFRGLLPTILRAFPMNAATFTVVTWILRLAESDISLNVSSNEALSKLESLTGHKMRLSAMDMTNVCYQWRKIENIEEVCNLFPV